MLQKSQERNSAFRLIFIFIYVGEANSLHSVGIGSDFDGIGQVPAGLEDVSKYPDLVRVCLHLFPISVSAGPTFARVPSPSEGEGSQLDQRCGTPSES